MFRHHRARRPMEVIPISISNTPASLGHLFPPYAPEFSVFLSESNSLRLSYSSYSEIERRRQFRLSTH